MAKPPPAVVGRLTGWLDEVLSSERRVLCDFVEQRHKLMAASLELRVLQAPPDLPQEAGAAEERTSESAATPQPKVIAKKEHEKVSFKEAKGFLHPHGGHAASPKSAAAQCTNEFSWPRTVLELIRWPFFEIFFTIVIVLNSMVTAAEVQYRGAKFGESMGWNNGGEAGAYRSDSTSEAVFISLGWIFGIVFTIELILKMVGERLQFFRSCWNLFDFVVIAFWLFNEVCVGDCLPLDPMALRVVRMVRVLKIMRMLRVLNKLESVNTLKLIVRTIACSGPILFWTILVFLLVVFLMSLLLNVMLDSYMTDADIEASEREKVYRYFGTFSGGMLSMFEVTIGNWVPITRLLSESVSEVYMVVFIIYKLTIGFAVVKVISGVFVQQTFKTAANDDELMVLQRAAQMRIHKEKMHELFVEVDESGDGRLSWPEFEDILHDERLKTWLSAMELEVTDAKMLFELLDDGDGALTAQELVSGVKQLKGSARSLDMVTLMREVKELSCELQNMEGTIRTLSTIGEKFAGAGKDFEAPGERQLPQHSLLGEDFSKLAKLTGTLARYDPQPCRLQEDATAQADVAINAVFVGEGSRSFHVRENVIGPVEGTVANVCGDMQLPRPHESAGKAVTRALLRCRGGRESKIECGDLADRTTSASA